MTVNVDLNIPVPGDADNYNLVVDLVNMRSGILDSLGDVIVELGQRPETGSAANFFSVTCTSTGTFKTSVTVDSADTGNALVLSNNSTSFGLAKSGVGSLTYTGGKWVSSSAIQIVDGVNAQDAASRNYVGQREAVLNAAINVVQGNVNALEAQSVVRYNGNQLWAPNANYATNAGYATVAGSVSGAVTPAEHSHAYAPVANRPEVYTGLLGPYSVPAKGTKNFTVPLPKSAQWPGALLMNVIDINGDEVFASTRVGWSNPGSAPCRLKNVSSGNESVRVMWAAIY